MISSRKYQLIIFLILFCIFVPVFAAEPNEPKTELKFETSIETMAWFIVVGKTEEDKPMYFTNPGPVKPSYVAKVLLHEDYPLSGSATGVMKRILESPIAKKFSKEQQQFFKTELVARIDNPERIPFYYSTWLYATSKEDTKLMVQAYIDGLNKSVEQRLSTRKQEMSEYQQELDKSQKELPDKQKQLKEVEKQYINVKEATYPFSSDNDAVDLAKKSIVDMDKTLNALDIELAGIREKLKAVEKYRNEPNLRDKLNEMYIELMIELSGLEARRKVTEQIRAKQQGFLAVYNRWRSLISNVNSLNNSIDRSNIMIGAYIKDMENRPSSLRSPKVYQNTVTIYPVLTDK